MSDHIHTVGDGRGLRTVFVNGEIVKRCIYADTKRGIARCYREPFKLHKRGKKLVTQTFRGIVEVVVK